MTEADFHHGLLLFWFGLAGVCFVVLLFVTAPYGRQNQRGWGPVLPARWGWFVMELPAVVVPLICYVLSDRQKDPVALVLLAMWLLHYGQRTLIYPFRMRMKQQTMPVLIAGLAFITNVGVNYLVARGYLTLGPAFAPERWRAPTFIFGVALFLSGMAINVHSDQLLRKLRGPGETGYKIPQGGLFRWISCPNYFGELIEWGGWALACASWPGLLFWVWSLANLVPRARSHHRWYRERFPEYPPDRRALLPGLW